MGKERFMTRQAVFIMLRNKKGDVLLQQRKNTGYLDGYWDFTASGHVERGESIFEAAMRELKEEVGIDCTKENLRLTHIDQFFLDADYINWIFVLDRWEGEPAIAEPDKIGDIRYFPVNNLPEKCVNNLRACMRGGLDNDLTFSITDHKNWFDLMGEELPDKN